MWRKLVLALLVGALLTAFAAPASAHGRHYYGGGYYGHHGWHGWRGYRDYEWREHPWRHRWEPYGTHYVGPRVYIGPRYVPCWEWPGYCAWW
jgi:hypothetical protein